MNDIFNRNWVYTRWQWYTFTDQNYIQQQQYIEQTIYPTLGGSKSADRGPSLRGIH